MNFLEEIVEYKKEYIKSKKESLEDICKQAGQIKKTQPGISRALKKPGVGLIAEIKVSSPTAGNIAKMSVEELAKIYTKNKVDCISVITDEKYFNGSPENIKKARKIFSGPILMKDFVISKYQVCEGAQAGASGVLLIASILSREQLKHLYNICMEFNMEPVVEVHSADELFMCIEQVDPEIIGVNSRNLNTLEMEPVILDEVIKEIPEDKIKIAESGIDSADKIKYLSSLGYDAVLIGGSIAGSNNPERKIREFTKV
ncbi:MAG: indole-3-glycerol phosphate synthase TrpC [Elusimicrobiota bacterium]